MNGELLTYDNCAVIMKKIEYFLRQNQNQFTMAAVRSNGTREEAKPLVFKKLERETHNRAECLTIYCPEPLVYMRIAQPKEKVKPVVMIYLRFGQKNMIVQFVMNGELTGTRYFSIE